MATYSHSKLAAFESCPRAYKFAYIERPEVEGFETADAFMGSRVHEVLQRLYEDLKYEKRNSLDDLLAYYDELWEENWSDDVKVIKEGLTPEYYKRVGERCIRDYYGATVLEGSRTTQSEIADAAGVFEPTIWRVWGALARRFGVEERPRDIATVRADSILQVPKPLVKELGLELGDRVRWSVRRKRLVGEKV